ncbi:MAG: ABC-type antimicrobial peptide transport system, ATPase component [Candidatus Fermentimicrarchaeum limneticum]|uniref:ABC-type antimicrobial peptide transport system, ATPase component n=1 Tax=Fermentimicrarchaeum limneticum TaxID=2795018 RepID=A0A7D5XCM8_FERL1|nr:MAG: ABC-type antimicrobial peptide transport system, ATPase component [Candidatus Fermentimicrarchaeum limneticum]
MDDVIKVENLKKKYLLGNVELEVLRGIDLTVKRGDSLSIMGPSGSGKSTLLHIMGCLDKPTSGRLYIDGTDVSTMTDNELAEVRSKKIGFVFQFFFLIPTISAVENVELPMIFNGLPPEDRRKRSAELLELVGLGERAEHKPSELSGGERQRVAIARALANDPRIVFTDEPTGNLDSKSGEEIIKLLMKLNKKGYTIVIVSHDINIARHAKKIVYIKDGLIEKTEVVK